MLVDVDAEHVLQSTLHSALKLVPILGCWHMSTLRSPKMKQSSGSATPLHVPAVVSKASLVVDVVVVVDADVLLLVEVAVEVDVLVEVDVEGSGFPVIPHVLHIAGHSE